MKILVINGANLNMLGIREPEIYGSRTYAALVDMIKRHAEEKNVEVSFMQSNHEGVNILKSASSYFAKESFVLSFNLFWTIKRPKNNIFFSTCSLVIV